MLVNRPSQRGSFCYVNHSVSQRLQNAVFLTSMICVPKWFEVFTVTIKSSSGLWRHVMMWLDTTFTEDHAASLRVKWKWMGRYWYSCSITQLHNLTC